MIDRENGVRCQEDPGDGMNDDTAVTGRAIAGRPADHEHAWKLSEGPVFVIDTCPPQYPYTCECGAFTHYPATGAPCRMCAPDDWALRTDDLVLLSGGPFDGMTVPRPLNKSVLYRCDVSDRPTQKHVRYELSDDSDVWHFRWYGWTQPAPKDRSDG